MPRWLQILLQVVATAAGAYAAHSTGTATPLLVSGGVNTLISGIAQTYNTDGTPQSQPYQPAQSTQKPTGQ